MPDLESVAASVKRVRSQPGYRQPPTPDFSENPLVLGTAFLGISQGELHQNMVPIVGTMCYCVVQVVQPELQYANSRAGRARPFLLQTC